MLSGPNLLPWGVGGAGVAGDGRGERFPPIRPPPHSVRAVLPKEDITQGAVPNNQLLVRCVPDRLVMQPLGLTNASLSVQVLETTRSQLPHSVGESNQCIPFHSVREDRQDV